MEWRTADLHWEHHRIAGGKKIRHGMEDGWSTDVWKQVRFQTNRIRPPTQPRGTGTRVPVVSTGGTSDRSRGYVTSVGTCQPLRYITSRCIKYRRHASLAVVLHGPLALAIHLVVFEGFPGMRIFLHGFFTGGCRQVRPPPETEGFNADLFWGVSACRPFLFALL